MSEDGQPSPRATVLGISSVYNCASEVLLETINALKDSRAINDQVIRLNGILGYRRKTLVI